MTYLSIGQDDGSYNKIMKELKKIDLVILDEWVMTRLDPANSRDLLEEFEGRYGYRYTLISGQLPASKWHELFEDSTITYAILDQLVYNAYRLELKGRTKRGIQQSQELEISEQQQSASSPSAMREGREGNHTFPQQQLQEKVDKATWSLIDLNHFTRWPNQTRLVGRI